MSAAIIRTILHRLPDSEGLKATDNLCGFACSYASDCVFWRTMRCNIAKHVSDWGRIGPSKNIACEYDEDVNQVLGVCIGKIAYLSSANCCETSYVTVALTGVATVTVPLNELVISGVPTTTQYHEMILEIEDFVHGNVDTGLIPKHADQLTDPPPPKTRVSAAAAACSAYYVPGSLFWRSHFTGLSCPAHKRAFTFRYTKRYEN